VSDTARPRLVWQLVAAFLVVSLVVVAAVTGWVTWRFSRHAVDEAETRLAGEAALAASALASLAASDRIAVEPAVRELAARSERSVQVWNARGEMVLGAGDGSAPRGPDETPNDVVQALQQGRGSQLIPTEDRRWLFASERSSHAGDVMVVRFGAPLHTLQPSVRRVGRTLATAAVVGALLSVALFLVAANRLIVPVLGELRRLEGVRRDFVANVSHELKTPITAARGMVETMLEDQGMEVETQRMFLFRIRDQLGRLSALVGDLLVLSRIESEGQQFEKATVDLRALALDCINAHWPDIENKQLQIARRLPEEPVLLLGDDGSLRQAIGNLIDNAIKYSPEGEAIEVGIERGPREARLWVSDSGPGIDPAHHDRIFERFYRVDPARSRSLGGTGLGLSIVKHVALAHGGNVSLESEMGRGSTFSLTFPLRKDDRNGDAGAHSAVS
jgi:signal transduction histidine kinase